MKENCTKKRKHAKSFLSAAIAILLSISIFAGTTFALFADDDKIDVSVVAGKVDVSAIIDENTLRVYSMDVEQTAVDANGAKLFENGGTASFDAEGDLALDRIVAGDKATFEIDVVNASNITVMFRVIWANNGELSSALVATADGDPIINGKTEWAVWNIAEGYEKTIAVSVELPKDIEDGYQNKSAEISYAIEFVQANADLPDEWDGTVDTSWYNETDTEFILTSAEQFAGFAALVSVDTNNFEGKTIVLDKDIDLGGEVFAPIGTTGEYDERGRLITESFKGTFDGNGKTIANLNQNGWAFGYEWGQYGSIGLFSSLESATVKNVVLEGFDCAIEGGDISFIAGSATGDCTFENIEIKSGSIGTYNNGIGGIIGWSGAGTYKFKDIIIGEDVVIGGLWGSFDSSVGGIVGQAEPGSTYDFENVNVACQLDVFNDCTAAYDYYNYRMSGMLIGRLEETTTIDGVKYPDTSKYDITCTNVIVTYGNWANYHYCRAEGERAKRVEAGYAYDGIAADYDHSVCTVYHLELISFDQVFGGAQYGVKGLKTYEGVKVVYNNK